MKSLNISKTLRIGLVATAISTLPLILPVSAQTSTTPGTDGTTGTTTTTDGTTTTTDRTYDDGFDWGWLGLLGLIGLAGLKRKPEDTTYRQDINEPTTTSRTDYR